MTLMNDDNTEDPLFEKQLLIIALHAQMQKHGQSYVNTRNNGLQHIDEWQRDQLRKIK